MIFSSQLYHKSSDFQEVFYESSIEITEVNEDLYMSQ